jgi:cytochrome c-type biogenesis protein CcmH/NrfG
VSPFVAALAVAALALVAAAGVVAGFRRREPVAVEPFADPLEDRRVALLRSLADLDDAHEAGALDEPTYGRLRADTEGRIARVLRAIDARHAGSLTPAASPARTASPRLAASLAVATGGVAPPRSAGRIPPWAVATLLVATVLSVVVASLIRDAEPVRTASAPAAADDPFAFFEQRVRDHPRDLAARLDLAHRYLDADRIEDALDQYSVALELDPDDAEAHAHVGLILYALDRPRDALDEVNRALETAPSYPEALFIRAVILLHGLDRPEDAIVDLEAYLDAAPFGIERATAQRLIEEARAASTAAASDA